MTERWEYLSATWVLKSHEEAKTPAGRNGYSYAKDLHIWHPGRREAEVRPLWSAENTGWREWPTTDDELVGPAVLAILNELGAEGWELVGEMTVNSNVAANAEDWKEVGQPVRHQWTFKRRAGQPAR